jgi:alpha-beta hydrolase superfamily lysophospholipase
MAERGYAALAFDHRTFGESGGMPRQLEDPMGKAADISAAVTALGADARTAGVPVYAVGVCAGGGYMVQAVVDDRRIAAFAGIAGVYHDADDTRASMGDAAYASALRRAEAAEQRWRETGEAETIPAVAPGNGDVAMPLDEAYAFYGTPRGAVANYVNGFAVQSRARTLPFDAQRLAARIAVPVIVIHSEKALAPAWARRFYAELTVEKQELWLQSQGQIDFYDDPALIASAADAVAQFFDRIAARNRS